MDSNSSERLMNIMFQNSKCRLHDLKAITPTLKSSIKFILNNFISNSELKYSFWSSYGRLSFQIKLQKEKLHTTRRTIVLRNGYIMVIYHLKKKNIISGMTQTHGAEANG